MKKTFPDFVLNLGESKMSPHMAAPLLNEQRRGRHFEADLKKQNKKTVVCVTPRFMVKSAASGNTRYSLCTDCVGVNAVSAALL